MKATLLSNYSITHFVTLKIIFFFLSVAKNQLTSLTSCEEIKAYCPNASPGNFWVKGETRECDFGEKLSPGNNQGSFKCYVTQN